MADEDTKDVGLMDEDIAEIEGADIPRADGDGNGDEDEEKEGEE